MVPPAANATTFEPAIDAMRALSRTALYVKVGHPHFPFEAAWIERLLDASPSVAIVDGSAAATRRDEDPHVWLSPRLSRRFAADLAAALESLLPHARDEIARNLAALDGEIAVLELEIGEILAPYRGRRFYVFHPAWGYFAEQFGLEQVAIEKEGKEPTAHDLAEISRRAREDRARVIFVQPQYSEAAADLLAREIGAEIEPLDPQAPDWDRNMLGTARALADSWGPGE
jgi:zinc transport system substrate-binding protein